jgi:hypothetical protein
MWKLLIVEPFFPIKNQMKLKLKTILEFGGFFSIVGKALGESNFI